MSDLGPENAIRLAHAQASEVALIAAKQAAEQPSGNVGQKYVDAYNTVYVAVLAKLLNPIS